MTFENLFDEVVIISVYTRKQAIEDGVLVDVSVIASEAGIKYPVAVTRQVWDEYIVPGEITRPFGQSEDGRLWDLLWMFRTAARRTPGSLLMFKCYFLMNERRQELVEFKSICGPGDRAEPVITIMMPWED